MSISGVDFGAPPTAAPTDDSFLLAVARATYCPQIAQPTISVESRDRRGFLKSRERQQSPNFKMSLRLGSKNNPVSECFTGCCGPVTNGRDPALLLG